MTVINHSYIFRHFFTRLFYKIKTQLILNRRDRKTREAQYNNIIKKIKITSSVGTSVDDKKKKTHTHIIILLVSVKEYAFSAWRTASRIPWAADSVIFLTTSASKSCYLTALRCSRFSIASISTSWTANSPGTVYAVLRTVLFRFLCVPLPWRCWEPYFRPEKQ